MTFFRGLGQTMQGLQNDPRFQENLMTARGVRRDEREDRLDKLDERNARDMLLQMGGDGFSDADILQLATVNPQLAGFAVKLSEQERLREKEARKQQMLNSLFSSGGDETGDSVGLDADTLAKAALVSGDPTLMQYAGMQGQRERELRQEERVIEKEERQLERKLSEEKRKPTEAQTKAFGFAERMAQAESNIADVPMDVLTDLEESALESVPIVGNFLVSEPYQLARQAQENWVTANLRKESGAVIGDAEMMREVKKYFPQPGDSTATIAQKAQSRQSAMRGMVKSAGVLGEDLTVPEAPQFTLDNLTVDDLQNLSEEELRGLLGNGN